MNIKKPILSEERKLRNITDYVFDCTRRLLEHSELLLFLGKNKDDFIDPVSKGSMTIIISIFDVYSRDSIVILGNILDEDRRTSSLYTLVDYIKDEKTRKRYFRRLSSIKKVVNPIIRARGNQVAHFNTKLNIHENGYIHINGIFQVDPRYTKNITKRIERFLWDIKEELSIEGLFGFSKGEPITRSLQRLLGNIPKR